LDHTGSRVGIAKRIIEKFSKLIMLNGARALAVSAYVHLEQKPPRYWISALLVFSLAFAGSQPAYKLLRLERARVMYFQFLMDHPRAPTPKFVVPVLIEDHEYWDGEPAGRVPLNRNYLARVVDSLVAADANVIALDFDTRLPNPESLEIPKEYKEETCRLIKAIKDGAAAGKKFVLATPISFDQQKRYQRDSDIYQANGLCKRRDRAAAGQKPCGLEFTDREQENVSCGYIALPNDILAVPGRLDTADGGKLDSFALAMARAARPALFNDAQWEDGATLRYGNYISESGFNQAQARYSTEQLLREPGQIRLTSFIAIVGANWRAFALGRGIGVDLHPTPLGEMVGALLAQTAPEWAVHVLEAIFSLIAALALAIAPGVWGKICALGALLVALFFGQWALLKGFNIFFDAFFPLVGLALHSLYERLLKPHGTAPDHI
jgi:CHASE2 domain